MASSSSVTFFISSLSLLIMLLCSAPSNADQPSFRPRALVLPVRKDASTLQYVATINQRTPRVPVSLVVHLGGKFLWVDCDKSYASSSYRPVPCSSAQCSLDRYAACGDCSDGPSRGCNNNTCGVFPENPFSRTATSGELAEDVVSVPSTDGSNPGPPATAPRFVFSCAPAFLLEGLARDAAGLAGLGRARIGVPARFSAAFSLRRKFAICLSASTSADGVVFFGDGPYHLLPSIDASAPLTYTPLYVNPVSTASTYSEGEPSTEYFIRVKSVRVNGSPIKINRTLLTIDREGNGGTKISTVDPYTLLETSIYRAFASAYVAEAKSRNMTRVSKVAPFDVCFSAENVGSTRVGPSVPYIDLVLQGRNGGAVWTITGSNSMVYVGDQDVLCLGFLDGGSNPRTSIVIGGHQIEDNLLEFDLAYSRLGFSSTLLGRQTTCANFNFTSNA